MTSRSLILVGTNLATAFGIWMVARPAAPVEVPSPEEKGRPDSLTKRVQAAVDGEAGRDTIETKKPRSAASRDIGVANVVRTSGHVPRALIHQYGLTEEQMDAVQAAISEHWRDMRESARLRSSYDEAASRPGEDFEVYRVKAMGPGERERMLQDLEARLRPAVGPELTADILANLAASPAFCYGGRYDGVFELRPGSTMTYHADGRQTQAVNYLQRLLLYRLHDPVTGELKEQREGLLSTLEPIYGNAFVRPRN